LSDTTTSVDALGAKRVTELRIAQPFFRSVFHPQYLKSLGAFTLLVKRATPAMNQTMSVHWAAPLEHQTLIVVPIRNSLAIKIFEQRNGIFSRQAGDLLEACDIDSMAAEFAYFGS